MSINSKMKCIFYDSLKDRLIHDGQAGRYALIGEGVFVGVWESYEDALQAGYNHFGITKRFLVKQIQDFGQAVSFTRDIQPAGNLTVN